MNRKAHSTCVTSLDLVTASLRVLANMVDSYLMIAVIIPDMPGSRGS